MNQIILSGIQITISIWEMWMCYEILYMTVLDKNTLTKGDHYPMGEHICCRKLVGN